MVCVDRPLDDIVKQYQTWITLIDHWMTLLNSIKHGLR